jgi:putative acetyltransferase
MKNRGIEEMNRQVTIRNEVASDITAIAEVTIAAFKNLTVSNHTEQYIIGALRAANALTISLVAELNGRVVGHVAFSPVTISDGSLNWYGLDPVSVLPEHQREGIGKSLIQEGLSRPRGLGAQGCCLVGDPKYYQRFGFRNFSGFVHKGVSQKVFLALPFKRHLPKGTVTFHKGFLATGQ